VKELESGQLSEKLWAKI